MSEKDSLDEVYSNLIKHIGDIVVHIVKNSNARTTTQSNNIVAVCTDCMTIENSIVTLYNSNEYITNPNLIELNNRLTSIEAYDYPDIDTLIQYDYTINDKLSQVATLDMPVINSNVTLHDDLYVNSNISVSGNIITTLGQDIIVDDHVLHVNGTLNIEHAMLADIDDHIRIAGDVYVNNVDYMPNINGIFTKVNQLFTTELRTLFNKNIAAIGNIIQQAALVNTVVNSNIGLGAIDYESYVNIPIYSNEVHSRHVTIQSDIANYEADYATLINMPDSIPNISFNGFPNINDAINRYTYSNAVLSNEIIKLDKIASLVNYPFALLNEVYVVPNIDSVIDTYNDIYVTPYLNYSQINDTLTSVNNDIYTHQVLTNQLTQQYTTLLNQIDVSHSLNKIANAHIQINEMADAIDVMYTLYNHEHVYINEVNYRDMLTLNHLTADSVYGVFNTINANDIHVNKLVIGGIDWLNASIKANDIITSYGSLSEVSQLINEVVNTHINVPTSLTLNELLLHVGDVILSLPTVANVMSNVPTVPDINIDMTGHIDQYNAYMSYVNNIVSIPRIDLYEDEVYVPSLTVPCTSIITTSYGNIIEYKETSALPLVYTKGKFVKYDDNIYIGTDDSWKLLTSDTYEHVIVNGIVGLVDYSAIQNMLSTTGTLVNLYIEADIDLNSINMITLNDNINMYNTNINEVHGVLTYNNLVNIGEQTTSLNELITRVDFNDIYGNVHYNYLLYNDIYTSTVSNIAILSQYASDVNLLLTNVGYMHANIVDSVLLNTQYLSHLNDNIPVTYQINQLSIELNYVVSDINIGNELTFDTNIPSVVNHVDMLTAYANSYVSRNEAYAYLNNNVYNDVMPYYSAINDLKTDVLSYIDNINEVYNIRLSEVTQSNDVLSNLLVSINYLEETSANYLVADAPYTQNVSGTLVISNTLIVNDSVSIDRLTSVSSAVDLKYDYLITNTLYASDQMSYITSTGSHIFINGSLLINDQSLSAYQLNELTFNLNDIMARNDAISANLPVVNAYANELSAQYASLLSASLGDYNVSNQLLSQYDFTVENNIYMLTNLPLSDTTSRTEAVNGLLNTYNVDVYPSGTISLQTNISIDAITINSLTDNLGYIPMPYINGALPSYIPGALHIGNDINIGVQDKWINLSGLSEEANSGFITSSPYITHQYPNTYVNYQRDGSFIVGQHRLYFLSNNEYLPVCMHLEGSNTPSFNKEKHLGVVFHRYDGTDLIGKNNGWYSLGT